MAELNLSQLEADALLMDEIQKLLEDYRRWLKDKTTLREIDGSWVEITTPYLDRHNDALQIFARREDGSFVLTDDSYTIHDLEASGCNLKTDKRRDLLHILGSGAFRPPLRPPNAVLTGAGCVL